MAQARIGIDVGGTFTDTYLDLGDGNGLSDKRLTTLATPEEAIAGAVTDLIARAGLTPDQIGGIVHGTTLATNAVIERRGARAALITTQGFRDVLEMGREDRYAQYDLNLRKPAPLVPRSRRLVVEERIAADGTVLLPLDLAALKALVPQLEEVESAAICFLNSYVNPAHEEAARDHLARLCPHLSLSISSEVAPVVREFERFSTAAANAYVQPLIDRYLSRLDARLTAAGLTCPRHLMLSSGSLCDFETGRRFPVRLIESGPAGGALFAARIAARHEVAEAMAFDLGGTTAKLTLIDHGRPHRTNDFEAARLEKFVKGSGLPLKVPSVDLLEIGAGGGSVAWLDQLGRLRVGPEGTGSTPGPACYGRGGTLPTVTDANLLLGRLSPESFAGGAVTLDPARAQRALDTLDMGGGPAAPTATATAILAAVDEAMALAARLHAVEMGAALGPRTLVAFGGGGPLHAASLAEAIGIASVMVPPDAGVGSAIGFLTADAAFEITRSAPMALTTLETADVMELTTAMEAEGRAITGDAPGLRAEWSAAMRYVGQGHEVAVALPDPLAPPEELRAAFEAAYHRLYGRRLERIGVEIISWTCRIAPPPRPAQAVPAPQEATAPAADGHAEVGGARHAALPHALYTRAALRPGHVLTGPCLVREAATSTAVPPGWEVRVLGDGTLHLLRLPQTRSEMATSTATPTEIPTEAPV
ncbi:hydantoinase/oxoprolinase family protein [Pseudooceanicola nanhaiensis]|uniref:hydantoinase/oxoprolinase family protein n=1 Tax=Pseudooceanicola nanhaiensis TaxID=375761 RepID=UPI001CD60BFD|nr:hydantoinase/oxoprolinase family protein [Pseudooceanicola nanhaiensis]MCA0919966.1 hydantoinase/oxoprolinase family protein [Pseudooceanicola nanhaiensis]